MKFKKVILLIIITIIMGLALTSSIYAGTNRELGILSLREGGYGYSANSKNIWKIVEYKNGRYTYDNAIYCLKGGAGFGNNSYIENRTYNVSYDMRKYSLIPDNMKNILPTDTAQTFDYQGKTYTYTNYNAVLSLLDNLYLPKDKNAQNNKEMLVKAAFPNLGMENFKLTDDDIEVVQQCAMWYFTNTDPNNANEYAYHMETLPALQLTNKEGGLGPFDTTLDDLDPTWTRQTQAQELYKFLLNDARIQAVDYGNGDIRGEQFAPAEFATDEALSDIIRGKIVVGPFRIATGVENEYEIIAKVTDQDKKDLSYKILDENKVELAEGKTLKDLVNKDFYISVDENENISKVKLGINIKYTTTDATFYTVGGAELIEQPVVIIENKEKAILKEVETPIVRLPFDLSLRKFITKLNTTDVDSREPQVDTTALKDKTTAIYNHTKTPVGVNTGDIVKYTIRVYNEGDKAGYAEEITDYIPEGLGFIVGHKVNEENYWKLSDGENINTVKLATIPNATNNLNASDFATGTKLENVDVVTKKAKITTNKLKYTDNATDNLLQPYNKTTGYLNYKDVEVLCVVTATDSANANLKNIAEITKDLDQYGAEVVDRDSLPNNVNINTYPANTNVEDDDDFENLVLKDFDLALRKFITKVEDKDIINRIPTPVIDAQTGAITYNHPKDVVQVKNTNTVIYTIRVYNEGAVDGYAKEITDRLPVGLEYIEGHEINTQYKWVLGADERTVTTNYLSKEIDEANLLKAFNAAMMTGPDYKDIKIACKVNLPNNSNTILINTAEIQNDSGKNGQDITDQDSTPGNKIPGEDDIDTEKVQIVNFDLALRKFITQINTENIDTRVPKIVLSDGKIKYNHPKDPLGVKNKDVVVYTIRVYNEGNINGFATEVKDNVPEGLIFLPDNEINKEYRWSLDEKGAIRTDYLSEKQNKENEIIAFEQDKMTQPAYKDLKVAFMVDEKTISKDRIIINTAEVSKDDNKFDAKDEDSTPDNNITTEDDIDNEYLIVKYFDLSLLKWVTQAIVTVDGKTTTIESGHTGLEDPEPVLKVDINKKKFKTTDVSFVYKIKITNEGEIAGYAKEIKDQIPAGLEFVATDNPKWHINANGEVVTDQLAETLLQPGESSEVEITLRWIKSEENLGMKVNVAEISQDYNEAESKDIDSTPNNKVEGEDDIDDAPVLLGISTGSEQTYLGLIGGVAVILGSGIYFIKRYVI